MYEGSEASASVFSGDVIGACFYSRNWATNDTSDTVEDRKKPARRLFLYDQPARSIEESIYIDIYRERGIDVEASITSYCGPGLWVRTNGSAVSPWSETFLRPGQSCVMAVKLQ